MVHKSRAHEETRCVDKARGTGPKEEEEEQEKGHQQLQEEQGEQEEAGVRRAWEDCRGREVAVFSPAAGDDKTSADVLG